MDQRRHALQLLADRDAEISRLNDLLSAQIAYGSRMKTRHAILLDTLDAMQAGHDAELRAALASNERLREALARQRDVVSVAELERDDLRDAVVQLVERVELAHGDFTSWAHSRMRIPRVLDPLSPIPTDLSGFASSGDLWAYASAMITSLRTTLSAERRAHAETRNTVRVLEAQLARREEEMLHTGVRATKSGRSARHSGSRLEKPPRIEEEDVERAQAENAVLEEEVRRLAERLHRAEVVAGKKKAVDNPPSFESNRPEREPILDKEDPPPRRRRKERRPQSRPKSHTRRPSPTRSPGPPLIPPTSNIPPHPQEPDPDPDRTLRPPPRRPPPSSRADSPPRVLPASDTHEPTSRNLHAEMDAEIEKLGSQIEVMTLERQRWLVLLSTLEGERERDADAQMAALSGRRVGEDVVESGVQGQRAERESQPSRAVDGVVVMEDRQDRDELPARAEVQVRSSQVQAEGPSLLPPSPPDDPLSLASEYYHQFPMEDYDYDGSLSMELATPILPTVVPQSSQISPLDLDFSAGLPLSSSSPRGFRERAGEADADAAVRELMDRASAGRGHG
ncbi:hypothetical protein FB45DRAFT_841319 [Roridomyces roridus]|uniref:Uncharacterized protein n=1 Tax=Roridomyces roridus TaxID=1738132 RepID=A0AAD7FF53_9AGAR|nr:hypothetical protein FB45DRAFT_841319 [Roridomyces roridus]